MCFDCRRAAAGLVGLGVMLGGLGVMLWAMPCLASGAGEDGAEALKQTSWWGEVQKNIRQMEYEITWQADGPGGGAYQAPNRAQNLRIYFKESGIEIVPRTGDGEWRWSCEWAGLGVAGSVRVLKPVSPIANGSGIEYVRQGLTERFENTEAGLEQEIVIEDLLPGAGPIRLEALLGGGLAAVVGEQGRGVSFEWNGSDVLCIGDLEVVDAAGTSLAAWMEANAGGLALVTDRGGALPIRVRVRIVGKEPEAIASPANQGPPGSGILASGLSPTPAWSVESNGPDAHFGWSVAGAGDVNGDGYDEVIVGAYGFDNGEIGEGRAFVYLGSSSGLGTTPAWTAEGNQALAYFGISVAGAGDVNGDGCDDVIVGAALYENGETDEGQAYAYLGSASGLNTTPAWTVGGNQAYAYLGISVAGAGDVNGDGYADVIVGAHFYSNGEPAEGRVYAYLGSGSGLGSTAAWTAESNEPYSYFGFSVASAGDVNGDGYNDVVIGAPHYSNPEVREGAAFVYLGSASGLAATAAWTAEGNQADAYSCGSVASAGDVNGDGYDDVIVGATAYTNGEEDEGRAYVYLGSASGLSATASWTTESNQVDAYFGCSVAGAGDVNGDGFPDVIVGAEYYDNGETGEGRAYVYHGSASGLSTSASWTAESNQPYAYFGYSVAGAGDVNGDGGDDVIVGAYGYDNGQTRGGAAFVYHGSPCGLPVSPAWTAEGNQASASFGCSVAGAGDVNGDLYEDVIVGAQYYDEGQSNEGRAFVFSGGPSGLATTPSWTGESNQVNAYFGCSVAGAGDVNADDYGDVIIGAYSYNNGETDEGRAYVYHGSASGLSTTANWTGESNQTYAYLGYSVAGAGDVHLDGYDDVIVGAPSYDNGESNEGRVFLYRGGSAGLEATASWTAESNQADAKMGTAVASAGDINADYYSEVIVGAPYYDNGQDDEGRAYVYLGSASGLSATPAWTGEGNQVAANYGMSVASAGNIDGDYYDDIIVGAPWYNNGQDTEGRAFVYAGVDTGLTVTPVWTAEANQAGANLGKSVGPLGDVNRDGYDDVIVGVPYYDDGQVDEGAAFVYYGSDAGLPSTPSWIGDCDQAGANFGWSVAGAGDANGDGYGDAIVGATNYDNGHNNEGAAFVFYGDGSTVFRTADWSIRGGQDFDEFGWSVAGAGDVNGDGYDDIIVGAPDYDNPLMREGCAFLYAGSDTGPAMTPTWTGDSNQSDAQFGRSVSSAGDVNGDGYDDVIVGAWLYSNGEFREGRAYAYHGSASGLSATPAWTAESDQVEAYFGESVSSAGDVNHDGYADAIVGADHYDNGQADEGKAYVYHGSASGLAGTPAWTAEGNQADAGLGSSVASAGDVNRDYFDDIIVGVPGFSNGQGAEGAAWVYHGSASGLAAAPSWAKESNQEGAWFGTKVAGAGDVNRDGYNDVVIGAPSSSSGSRVYVFHGSASGLAATASWSAFAGGVGSYYFGRALAGAGDVVADGYDDLVIGSALHKGDDLYEGRVLIYGGSPSGLSNEPVWVSEGNEYSCGFGISVAGAGDVNGDGLDDVVVGADGWGRRNHGRVYVFYGEGDVSGAPEQPTPEFANILFQNYPNPFLGGNGTTIRYRLARTAKVDLRIFDVTGRLVKAVSSQGEPGDNCVTWDGTSGSGRPVASGVYFYSVSTTGFNAHKKMILVR